MIVLTLFSIFMWYRGKLFDKRWLLWVFVFSAILPQIANQVGWYATEMGRQPWVVYGLLKTSRAFSQAVSDNQILFSLILFALVYSLLFVLFVYLLNRKIQQGPYDESGEDDRPFTKELTDMITQ